MVTVYRNGGTMGVGSVPVSLRVFVASTYAFSRLYALGHDFEFSNTDFESLGSPGVERDWSRHFESSRGSICAQLAAQFAKLWSAVAIEPPLW
jgi:hypothetical protein